MSKELITKIKQTELEANRIRNGAKEEAKARIQKAENDGKKLCADTLAQVEREDGKKIELTQKRAQELLETVKIFL